MTKAEHLFAEEVGEHRAVVSALDALSAPFAALVGACTKSLRNGGKLLFFGNGGSAADAQHLATEFVVRYRANRPALAAIALTTDTSALTAIGNDFGFEDLFSRQVEGLGKPGDVAIGLSTSGTSPNVVKGLMAARRLGGIAVGFGGGDGGRLPALCDISLIVPSRTTARIQECHILLGHMVCAGVEAAMGGENA